MLTHFEVHGVGKDEILLGVRLFILSIVAYTIFTMHPHLQLVADFHKKYDAPILSAPSPIVKDRWELRYKLMREELEEYRGGASRGDIENVAKELADLAYAVYGTILEHGLASQWDTIFQEVHRSNMSKERGEYKMIKGEGYMPADLKRFFQASP